MLASERMAKEVRMTHLSRPLGRLARVAGLALVAVLAVPAGANAATAVPVTFDCQARPPIGAAQQLTLDSTVQTTARASTTPGGALLVILAAEPMTVPATAAGYDVEKISNLVLKLPVPKGTAYQGSKLLGGSGLGPKAPSVRQSNGVINLIVPGPIAGGATFQLPAVHLALRVTGAAGTTVDSRIGGTSYVDPGLLFVARVKVGVFGVDVPTSCFPNPSPTLTSTKIEDPASS
jgi:dehydratase